MATYFDAVKLRQYGQQLNSHDLIKIFATILMFIDHMGEYWFHHSLYCRLLGRGAAPLFFFVVGYAGHLHLRPSLIIYGLILTAIGSVINDHFFANILINFIFIHYFLTLLPFQQFNLPLRILFFTACLILNYFIYPYLEYGLFGLMFAYSAQLISQKDLTGKYWLGVTFFAYFCWENTDFRIYTMPYGPSLLIALLGGLFMIMIFYRLRSFNFPLSLTILGLIIARYSLEIYFFHLFLLQAIYLTPLLLR